MYEARVVGGGGGRRDRDGARRVSSVGRKVCGGGGGRRDGVRRVRAMERGGE